MEYRLLPLILLAFSINLSAASLTSEEDTFALCEKSVSLFGPGKATDSFEVLAKHWLLPKHEITNLVYQTDSQLSSIGYRYGKPVGIDFISTERLGNSFLRHTFMRKFENHALRFICIFYKPENIWVVNSVHWDDDVSESF
ncbi:hypothetical protein [Endozoicomonas atrinae]|uniref:hypothetical protein n=1 Tax=Endozoicomonas atrinae TaxID=1333660 RepID=UPI000824BE5D|nr:hypothetical protein [Endozoicomonas atrinae]